MDLLSKLSLDTPDLSWSFSVLDEVWIKKKKKTKLYKALVICDNDSEASFKGSVFQVLQCRVSFSENTPQNTQELPAKIAGFETSDHLYLK